MVKKLFEEDWTLWLYLLIATVLLLIIYLKRGAVEPSNVIPF